MKQVKCVITDDEPTACEGLRFKEFQFCLELVIFYLLQLQALSFIFLLYHLITQEYIKEAAKQHTDYGRNRHIV